MEYLYPFIGLAGIVLGGAVAVWQHRKTTRVNLDADAERAKLAEQTQPLAALITAMQGKDAMLERLFEQQRAESMANTRALNELASLCRSMSASIESYRADNIRRAEKLYAWLQEQEGKMDIILDRTQRHNGKAAP